MEAIREVWVEAHKAAKRDFGREPTDLEMKVYFANHMSIRMHKARKSFMVTNIGDIMKNSLTKFLQAKKKGKDELSKST